MSNLLDLINFFPNKPWNWYCISRNSNITWDIIRNNPDKPWDWNGLSENINITWDIINDNPDKPSLAGRSWNWEGISENINITWDIIIDNPDKPWDWNGISLNEFNYDSYFKSSFYIKNMTKKMHDIIKEELISKSCHPDRIFNWNEDFCKDYPEEYKIECDKWM
jgi:hypothetical protein